MMVKIIFNIILDTITSFAITNDDKYLVSASKDRSIIVHSISTNDREFQIPNAHGVSVNSVCVYKNTLIISAGGDKNIAVHNILTREKLFTFENVHEGKIYYKIFIMFRRNCIYLNDSRNPLYSYCWKR